MSPVLQDIIEFVDRYPHATVWHLTERFGRLVFTTDVRGIRKVYTHLVFQRGGQFVDVLHCKVGDGSKASEYAKSSLWR